MQPGVALHRQLALYDSHLAKADAIVAGDDREREAVARGRVVDEREAAVPRPLCPDLGFAGHERRRDARLLPRLPVVARAGDPPHFGDAHEQIMTAEEGVAFARDPFVVSAR